MMIVSLTSKHNSDILYIGHELVSPSSFRAISDTEIPVLFLVFLPIPWSSVNKGKAMKGDSFMRFGNRVVAFLLTIVLFTGLLPSEIFAVGSPPGGLSLSEASDMLPDEIGTSRKIIGEETALREEEAKHFLNNDGTYTARRRKANGRTLTIPRSLRIWTGLPASIVPWRRGTWFLLTTAGRCSFRKVPPWI